MILKIADSSAAPLEVNYDSSMSRIGAMLKATYPISDLRNGVKASLGSAVSMQDDSGAWFDGIVTSISSTESKLTITAYDLWYHISKTKIIIQFTDGIQVDEALRELFKKVGVPLSFVPAMRAKVDSTYYIQTPAEIARSLIAIEENENGGEYYISSNGMNSIGVYLVGSQSCGLSLTTYISASKQESLDAVRNRIVVLVTDGDGYTELESAQDGASISSFGWLTDYIKISEVDASAASAIASNKLEKQGQPIAEGNVTVRGDWRLTAIGKRIAIKESITNLTGEFIITGVSHRLGDDFKTTLTLREHRALARFKETITGSPEDRAAAVLKLKQDIARRNRK